MSFPCTQCGLCCSTVGKVVEKARELAATVDNEKVKEVAAFPHGWDATGRCEMLADDNSCKVYDNRPSICSIDKTREKYHPEISAEEYYKMSWKACERLMEKSISQ